MIKHIVLFKLKSTLSQKEKEAVAQEFKAALEALPGKIDFLRSLEVGINGNAAESYDIALTALFDTFEDLKRYAAHPDHIAASQIIKESREERACVDYIL